MSGILPVIVMALMGATLFVMIGGIFMMAKGGEANAKYGNRLMTLRVTLQAATIIAFAILVLSRV
jgi:hypothetical protein